MNDQLQENDARFFQLQEAVNSDPDNPIQHYNLAISLWEKREVSREYRERAIQHFIVSAKLNPNNGQAFRFLGHCYSQNAIDLQRALKCYQRAVNLNPDDFEAGECLCDLLDDEGKEVLEIEICTEVREKSRRAFWAYRRLGLLMVYRKKWSEAVQSLQHAIRGYPTCADLWEALGLAYQRLGMFTAAMKSYGRAIELENSRIFSLIESGNISLVLGFLNKGIEHFRQALKISPYNVAANYGLASGLFGMSKDCINSGAFVWAASLLEEASDIVKSSACIVGNTSSIWKLHGDIQITYARCLPWTDDEYNSVVDEEIFKSSIHTWKRKCVSAAILAKQSYQKAMHLTPWKANAYTDLAVALDHISYLNESNNCDLHSWQLTEKICLGGLLLEGNNGEIWVSLGYLSNHNALKNHAFIRALQLDVSLALAWAHLGILYKKGGENLLSKQALDHARSINPSLALPWAAVSADPHVRDSTPDEAYESCLRAVQSLPLAEFQIGLADLSLHLGHLLSPQVFACVQQAVQHAPCYPETHNLMGLVYEARSQYNFAVSSYRKALCCIKAFAKVSSKSQVTDILVNLARSLLMAGHAKAAARECENLKNEGFLDNLTKQVYAISLWKLGKNDLALSVVTDLASNVLTMDKASSTAGVCLICKLLYHMLGLKSALNTIIKLPSQLFQSLKLCFIISVTKALDSCGRLEALESSCFQYLTSHDDVTRLHSLISSNMLILGGSDKDGGLYRVSFYLRRILHMFPGSSLIRNQLAHILLCCNEWKSSHNATRCLVIRSSECNVMEGSKTSLEILGAASIACYASCTTKGKYSFPTCKSHNMNGEVIHQLQRWLHQEPWNDKARYLLILNILQRAREERFPSHLLFLLDRLVSDAISSEIYSTHKLQYQKFQLLLCASEVYLQSGDFNKCINLTNKALDINIHENNQFFTHLQLCRVYAAKEDFAGLKDEFLNCLKVKTKLHIGWISLKILKLLYNIPVEINSLESNYSMCLDENRSSGIWMSIFDLVSAQGSIWVGNLLQAEESLAHACLADDADGCLFLIHGCICMDLARMLLEQRFLNLAIKSLSKAQKSSSLLPFTSLLLAQAEGSLGHKKKWEKNLPLEWFSWPSEMRPAELYFQMYLLSIQSKSAPCDSLSTLETSQTPIQWMMRARHLNPSCSRYWIV